MSCVRLLLLGLLFCSATEASPEATTNRAQRYAAFKAHTIMPPSLRQLFKREGRAMFTGLDRGLSQNPATVDDALIMRETKKISAMIDGHSSFKAVIQQMGYVSGLVGIYTNPSLEADSQVRKGFQYYLNLKLDRCLFVFDGHEAFLSDADLSVRERQLTEELRKIPELRRGYSHLLADRYGQVRNDWRYNFDEQSAVFGVTSIYFSNMARLTAHLWYYAWASAHGDLSRTPLRGNQNHPGARKRS